MSVATDAADDTGCWRSLPMTTAYRTGCWDCCWGCLARTCRVRLPDWVNAAGQMPQRYGRCPVWTLMWRVRLERSMNPVEHTTQTNWRRTNDISLLTQFVVFFFCFLLDRTPPRRTKCCCCCWWCCVDEMTSFDGDGRHRSSSNTNVISELCRDWKHDIKYIWRPVQGDVTELNWHCLVFWRTDQWASSASPLVIARCHIVIDAVRRCLL